MAKKTWKETKRWKPRTRNRTVKAIGKTVLLVAMLVGAWLILEAVIEGK